MAFGAYIPALIDGSASADGNPITTPAGFTHNNSEYDIQQTDAFDVFDAQVSFWGDGSSVWNEKTKAEMDAHQNGLYNLWFKYDSNENVVESVQYPLSKVFTQEEFDRNVAYFGGTPIGGIVPFP